MNRIKVLVVSLRLSGGAAGAVVRRMGFTVHDASTLVSGGDQVKNQQQFAYYLEGVKPFDPSVVFITRDVKYNAVAGVPGSLFAREIIERNPACRVVLLHETGNGEDFWREHEDVVLPALKTQERVIQIPTKAMEFMPVLRSAMRPVLLLRTVFSHIYPMSFVDTPQGKDRRPSGSVAENKGSGAEGGLTGLGGKVSAVSVEGTEAEGGEGADGSTSEGGVVPLAELTTEERLEILRDFEADFLAEFKDVKKEVEQRLRTEAREAAAGGAAPSTTAGPQLLQWSTQDRVETLVEFLAPAAAGLSKDATTAADKWITQLKEEGLLDMDQLEATARKELPVGELQQIGANVQRFKRMLVIFAVCNGALLYGYYVFSRWDRSWINPRVLCPYVPSK